MDPLKTQPPPEAKLHFLDYWRIIRIRKAVILAVFLLVATTATVVTLILPKSFASTARIKVERDMTDIASMTGSQYYGGYDPYFIQTEFELIQSEGVLGKVIDRLDLNTAWGRKYRDGEKLKTQETIKLLKSRLDLSPVRNTMLIAIRVFSDDPQEAADLANAIADAYQTNRLEQRKQMSLAGISALMKQFQDQEIEIRKVQTNMDHLRKTLRISDLDAQNTAGPSPALEAETVRRMQTDLISLETQFDIEQKKMLELAKLDPDQRREAIQTAGTPDTELATLLGLLNGAEQKLVQLGKELTTNNLAYQNANDLAHKIREQANRRVDGIMIGLSNRVGSWQVSIESLSNRLEQARLDDYAKAEQSAPYYEEKRNLDNLLSFRKILEMKIASEKIDVNLPTTGMVEIVDTAKPETRAVRPNRTLNITLGIVVGLIVGLGLAFFIEYLDTSVKTIDDVERALQTPVLGVIPQNVGYLMEEGAESPHAEAYRVLRTNLLFSRKDDKLNTLAVVSAGAGEGKSTTVVNLATVFAQSGQRVLVVDSDLRRPTLHKTLHVTNNLGLTNYLLKQNTLEQVIQTTALATLHFMASGKLPSSSLGILNSTQMKDLITELKQRYDFVFFDSPPIMGVSDASILASEVDMTLQVIQYRRYPQPMNIRAKQLIEKVGGNLIGIVLNNINMSQDESYCYYSGYYHDYYSKNEEMAETPSDKKKPGVKQKH